MTQPGNPFDRNREPELWRAWNDAETRERQPAPTPEPEVEEPRFRPAELDAWLARPEPDYQWLIPGLLERGDRVILTGKEGHGKSTLLRQIGVQAASGIHPFGGDPYPALRVLLLDLENSERQLRRQLRPLRIAAGDNYAGGFRIQLGGSVNLLKDDHKETLLELVKVVDPDILITGPSYKLVAGPPVDEGPASIVANVLDTIRRRHDCAILLEAHQPYASAGTRRPERPYGASLWSRWPEFGLALSPADELHHWRGQRDERAWPMMLRRGGPWPFESPGDADAARYARIAEECQKAGVALSRRDLSEKTGMNRNTVSRVIGRNGSYSKQFDELRLQLMHQPALDEDEYEWHP